MNCWSTSSDHSSEEMAEGVDLILGAIGKVHWKNKQEGF